jgi:hypothetical protein
MHAFLQAVAVLATLEQEVASRDAYAAFFNGRYAEASEKALALVHANPEDLSAYELRTSALLFEMKRLVAGRRDKEKAFKECVPCPALLAEFMAGTRRAQQLARARIQTNRGDIEALFFLGKIDLNYVWLQLGPLGRRKGWDEYWEARRSLDGVLARDEHHVRARVARAWIDYIVDTRVPFAVRWLLGGGNRKGALVTVEKAAASDADFVSGFEAKFSLWDMQVSERRIPQAVETARTLAASFPDNAEVQSFLDERATEATAALQQP